MLVAEDSKYAYFVGMNTDCIPSKNNRMTRALVDICYSSNNPNSKPLHILSFRLHYNYNYKPYCCVKSPCSK